MIHIALTDDHPLLLAGLKNILAQESAIHVDATYPSVLEMHQALTQDKLDVLLLDINIHDINTIELIKPLRKRFPHMNIIMLSVHNEYAVINSCLQEGALGYIQKNAALAEIIEGIHSVYEGRKYLCTQTRRVVEANAKNDIQQVPKLTRREKEILLEVGAGYTTQQIADKLFISTHTVESHRKNLIQKFQTANLSSALKLALEYGLIPSS